MHLSPPTSQLDAFLVENGDIKYVWVQFMTYTGDSLVRMVPVSKFFEMIQHDQALSVTKALLNIIPNGHLADGATLTGSVHLKPDLLSLHRRPGSNKTRAVVMAWWMNKDGNPVEQCARSKLQSLTDQVRATGFSILVGFEVELILMQQRTTVSGEDRYEPINTDHSWSTMTADDEALLDFLEEVVDTLKEIGIDIQQFHGELAPGQWEFVLPPEGPLKAVDRLVITRKTIMGIAQKYGLHATFHPRPIPDGVGTGAHAHLSLNREEEQDLKKIESFFAGILGQFPSISAFTLSHDVSYDRVADDMCAGGTYVSWGWDNRETVLRRIDENRFEIKMMDALGNPYLSLCALLAAGLDGLLNGAPLTAGPCEGAPYRLSAEEKEALGIRKAMPKSIDESLDALTKNTVLPKYMGEIMVSTYIGVKKGELRELRAMTPAEARKWLISHY